jgi:hypothetical protein
VESAAKLDNRRCAAIWQFGHIRHAVAAGTRRSGNSDASGMQ